jgi:hypothetical protein
LQVHALSLTRTLVTLTLYVDIRSDGFQEAVRQPEG